MLPCSTQPALLLASRRLLREEQTVCSTCGNAPCCNGLLSSVALPRLRDMAAVHRPGLCCVELVHMYWTISVYLFAEGSNCSFERLLYLASSD